MIRIYIALFFAVILSICFGKEMENLYQDYPEFEEVAVVRVVDGDTLLVLSKTCGIQKVRMVGIDTPESTIKQEPFGKTAAEFTLNKIKDSGYSVTLEGDGNMYDRFGRRMSIVWLNKNKDESLNLMLIREGLAIVRTDFKFSNDNLSLFLDNEKWSYRIKKGIWSDYEGKSEKVLLKEKKLR